MIRVEIQNASAAADVPNPEEFRTWARAAVKRASAEIVIRIVDRPEGTELNERYRGKSGPTNVLSFPFQAPPGIADDVLGDLVICAPVVREEASVQGKTAEAHWAHLTVHGVLHLQGFDHLEEREAEVMEAEETAILAELGYPDPYHEVTVR